MEMNSIFNKKRIRASSNSLWTDTTLVSDFMKKELVKKLNWIDVISLIEVNKYWQSLFSSDDVWKRFFDEQYPFESSNVSMSYFENFQRRYNSFNGKHSISNEIQ